jgi:hypothetical protein
VTAGFGNFTTAARSRTRGEAWTSEEALCAAALDDPENPRRIGVRAEKLSR